MKKLIIIVFIFILGVVSFLLVTLNIQKHTGKTFQEAISITGRNATKFIGEVDTKDGKLVFFLKNSNNVNSANLVSGFIKKNLFGWKWIYGGEHGTIGELCKTNGFSSQYLPNVKNTPFPLLFGVITDTKISNIKILELERNISKNTKLISDGDITVWYTFCNDLKGHKFQIIGSLNDGQIKKVEDLDISPYSAEQEPMEQSLAKEYMNEILKK